MLEGDGRTGYAMTQPPNRKLTTLPFLSAAGATGRSNTVKQTVPGATIARQSIPEITDCQGVAVATLALPV